MQAETIAFIVAGAAAGGFVNGLAGFGTALFALGWFLQVTSPVQAVAIVLVLSIASGVRGLWVVRHAIEAGRLVRFLVPGLLGIPVGLWLLQHVDAEALTLLVAACLILYGVFFALRGGLPRITRPIAAADVAVGLAGGVLGGVAGLSGVLPTMWCTLNDWSKTVQRGVLQPYNMGILGLSAIGVALGGGYGRETLGMLAIAVPTTLIAAELGLKLFHRMSDAAFRATLVGLLTLSGVVLIVQAI